MKEKMKIKLLVGKVIDGSVYPAESVVEVESGLAQLWIDAEEAIASLPSYKAAKGVLSDGDAGK